jgi:hypothetical protein
LMAEGWCQVLQWHALALRGDEKGRLLTRIAVQKAGKWSPSLLVLIEVNHPIGMKGIQ